MMNAKRVDVAIAEVQDGRIIRHKNLGNVLQLVGSKPTLMQHIIDGAVNFSKQSRNAGTLNAPGIGGGQAAASNKTVAIYIVQSATAAQDQRVNGVISNSLSRSFPQLAQNQKINVSFIDPKSRDNANWLGYVKARPGDVVVALMGDGGMETFSSLPGPANQNQEAGFMNSFVGVMQQYAGSL